MPIRQFRHDDLFFDIEIRGNFFVCSQLYPTQKKVIVSFLEEINHHDQKVVKKSKKSTASQSRNGLINLTSDSTQQESSKTAGVIQENENGFLQTITGTTPKSYKVNTKPTALQEMEKDIRQTVHYFADPKSTTIEFENLAKQTDFEKFAKRYGFVQKLFKNQYPHDFLSNQVQQRQIEYPFNIEFDTDNRYQKEFQNGTEPGLRIGYNSQNYDQTMLAHIIAGIMNSFLVTKINEEHRKSNQKIQQDLNAQKDLIKQARKLIQKMSQAKIILKDTWLIDKLSQPRKINDHLHNLSGDIEKQINLFRAANQKDLQNQIKKRIASDKQNIKSLEKFYQLSQKYAELQNELTGLGFIRTDENKIITESASNDDSQTKFYNLVINSNHASQVQMRPSDLTQFNSHVFKQDWMPSALNRENKSEMATYNAWKLSNRFIDVSQMNPKHISLKRCAMALGYKIQESNTNRDPKAKLKTLKDFADVVAYNVNDIYLTMKVFEHSTYWNRYQQNKQLLKEFPYFIYTQSPDVDKLHNHLAYTKGENHIRRDRLTINSTSRQLVENTIAPYPDTKVIDNLTLNFQYPDAKIAAQKRQAGTMPKEFKDGKPMNMLLYVGILIKERLQGHSTKVQQAVINNYKKIVNYYSAFEGKNFNDEMNETGPDYQLYKEQYKRQHPGIKDSQIPKAPKAITVQQINKELGKKGVTIPFITPEFVYKDKHHVNLKSYIVLSVGGAHGAEAQYGPFHHDMQQYLFKIQLQQDTANSFTKILKDPEKAKAVFGDNAKELINNIVTFGNLAQYIAKMYPDQPFTYVKRHPLFVNPDYTFKDIMTSSSSRKRPRLRHFKRPKLFDKSKIYKDYSYTSCNWANHEDFSSYYPSLITNMAVFRNRDGNDIYANNLYHPRLKLKKVAKRKVKINPNTGQPYTEAEVSKANLRQLSMKLLINSATGAGDATFTSRVRCNNKILQMRIIGQLFCWYIGQSLALEGARVPSTNTDGLYTMNIAQAKNDAIVKDCAKKILLDIGPEKLDLFVSKDANNRLEKNDGHVTSARGGALTSWQGPSTDNRTAHPAIIDFTLAQYLAKVPDSVNQPFDRQIGKQILTKFIFHRPKFYGQPKLTDADMLRFFQFPLVSNYNTGKVIFKQNFNEKVPHILNPTNRVFLVKSSPYTMKTTQLHVVLPSSINKRAKELKFDKLGSTFDDIISAYCDHDANFVLKKTLNKDDFNMLHNQVYNPHATSTANKPRDIKIGKITDFPENQPSLIINDDLHNLSHNQYLKILTNLDLKAYLDLVETKFEKQWHNHIKVAN